MKIICLGDSLTYGYGVSRKKTWVSLCAEKTGIEMVNAGLTGDTTGGMLARFGQEVSHQNADYVFLMGGANDIFLSGEIGAAKANLGAMAYRAMAEGLVPILGIPTRPHPMAEQSPWGHIFDISQAALQLEALSQWLLRYAAGFGIKTVDFRDCLGTPPEKAYYLEGLHVTPQGHERMAEQFLLATGLTSKGQTAL